MEIGPLCPPGACSEPGTTGDHDGEGGPGAQHRRQLHTQPRLRAWPPGRQAASVQVSRHLNSTQPMLSPWINLLLPFP